MQLTKGLLSHSSSLKETIEEAFLVSRILKWKEKENRNTKHDLPPSVDVCSSGQVLPHRSMCLGVWKSSN